MLNKVTLIGNIGKDVECRSMQSGDKVANFSLATSESWKDKSGERQKKVEWHNIVVFNKGLVSLCENYLKKGSKIYLEGQIQTRKWAGNDGVDKYTTEIVLRPFRSEIVMLDSKGDATANEPKQEAVQGGGDFEGDAIPFMSIPDILL